jgi:hypothetical protein
MCDVSDIKYYMQLNTLPNNAVPESRQIFAIAQALLLKQPRTSVLLIHTRHLRCLKLVCRAWLF